MTPLAYSVAEAAQELGVSTSLVYKLVRQKELPSVRLGDRRLVVPHTALEAWLLERAACGSTDEEQPPTSAGAT